ncbi:MAG: redoxin domain-containing protein [Bacteroidia bacterium]
MNRSLLSVAVLLLIFSGCGEKTTGNNTEAEAQPFFTPNPQMVEAREITTLPIGAKAPDFRLPGVDDRFYTLADFDDAKVLAIIFTCNHCPTAQAYEDRTITIANEYKDKGVQIVAISPNSPPALLHEECGYTDLHDTFEEMKIRAKDKAFPFPYLYDGDTEEVSVQYGPVATPHVFVFDQSRSLQYVGRLDASEKPGTANAEDLRAALDAVLAGTPVANPETKTFGCSVKWAWKNEYTLKVDKEWKGAPVTLLPLDEAGVKALVANDSEKLRLINIWATWCGPCILEYPEFVEIHRMYKGRDFEFISLTADSPEHHGKALAFLQKQASALTNYAFSTDDKYALIEAVDPKWNGALPYTLLVEPGGNIVYASQGVIDPLELKKTIVEHPMIGRYY